MIGYPLLFLYLSHPAFIIKPYKTPVVTLCPKAGDETVPPKLPGIHLSGFNIGVYIVNEKRMLSVPIFTGSIAVVACPSVR